MLSVAGHGEHRGCAAVLHAGADDAISTPLHVNELAARCHVMLRRSRQLHSASRRHPSHHACSARSPSILADAKPASTTKKYRPLASSSPCLNSSAVGPPKCALAKSYSTPSRALDGSATAMSSTCICRTCVASSTRQLRARHTVRGVSFRLANDVTDAIEIPDTVGVA